MRFQNKLAVFKYRKKSFRLLYENSKICVEKEIWRTDKIIGQLLLTLKKFLIKNTRQRQAESRAPFH